VTITRGLSQRCTPIAFATIATVCAAGFAGAGTIDVDISGLVNADLTTYTGGFNYPQHGGPLTVAGVPFTLATIGPNSDTAVIQTSTDFGGSQTYSIPVGIFGVTSADTLINSAFGTCGTNIGELDFVGASNTYTYTLTEGANVRDHFNGAFCNTVTNVAGTASFGGGADRLDMQQITLPASFATDTLQRIDFKGFGQGGNGSPFLAAAAVVTGSPVPEPATLTITASALLALLLSKHRAQRSGARSGPD
jgi:hypothetical protein